jgi:hypothetical protein
MVPIHDTDVAEERWSKGGWENYELWEKVELRLRRHKRFWIAGTVLVFLVLSAVPIVMDRWPKWASRTLARQLALEINRIKKDASVTRSAYRLVFSGTENLAFSVFKLTSCLVPHAASGEVIRSGVLFGGRWDGGFALLSSSQGQGLGIPGLIHEFCYDPFQGSSAEMHAISTVGFGIIPVKDLTEKRVDRLTVLLLSGPSADISFD